MEGATVLSGNSTRGQPVLDARTIARNSYRGRTLRRKPVFEDSI